MNVRKTLPRLAASVAALAACTAMAAPAGETIEISAPVPRYDVHALCPAIDDQLANALARAWHETSFSGTVDVMFTLKGQSVEGVTTSDGPWRLQRMVQRAVRLNVGCASGDAAPQVIVFKVDFAPAAGSDSSSPMAAARPLVVARR